MVGNVYEPYLQLTTHLDIMQAVAAAITLGPLQSRLRNESETALQDERQRGEHRAAQRFARAREDFAEE